MKFMGILNKMQNKGFDIILQTLLRNYQCFLSGVKQFLKILNKYARLNEEIRNLQSRIALFSSNRFSCSNLKICGNSKEKNTLPNDR